MNAVILFSHGSLLCGAGGALSAHAERLLARGLAPIVEVAYLNYTRPGLPDAVRACVTAGATSIVITPYFLVPGKFVRTDIPIAVAAARREFPGLLFHIAEPMGYDDLLVDAVIDSAMSASPPDNWYDDLSRTGEACRGDIGCPLYGTAACPKQPGPVVAGIRSLA